MSANVEQKDDQASAPASWLDALERFLENHGEEFLSWSNGCVRIETYYEKQFRALGGNTDRLIAYFEDYCNAQEASEHYIASLRGASNGGSERRQEV